MEVGVGLSLAFAVLDRVRAHVRTFRVEKSRNMLDEIEASTEQIEIITEEVNGILNKAIGASLWVEKIGTYLAAVGVLLLVIQLILVGFYNNFEYDIYGIWVCVIIPSFLMPILIFFIYIVMGVMSGVVRWKVRGYKNTFKSVSCINKKLSLKKVDVTKEQVVDDGHIGRLQKLASEKGD